MSNYPSTEILCAADAEMVGVDLTLRNVDVCELMHLFWVVAFAFAPLRSGIKSGRQSADGLTRRFFAPGIMGGLTSPGPASDKSA